MFSLEKLKIHKKYLKKIRNFIKKKITEKNLEKIKNYPKILGKNKNFPKNPKFSVFIAFFIKFRKK